MALSSASTLAEITIEYDDNCDYDLNGSVTQCKAFIKAARMLLRRMVEEVRAGDSTVRDSYEKIKDALDKAESWWASNDTATTATATASGSVRHLSFEDYRS